MVLRGLIALDEKAGLGRARLGCAGSGWAGLGCRVWHPSKLNKGYTELLLAFAR